MKKGQLEVDEDHIAVSVAQNVSVLQVVVAQHHLELLLLRQGEHALDLLRNQVDSDALELIAGAWE